MAGAAIFDMQCSAAPGQVQRISVAGELDAATGPQLLSRLRATRTTQPVCLDLSGVTFIDCSGLTVLLIAVRSARRAGRDVELDQPVSRPVQRIIEMVGAAPLLWPDPSARADAHH